MNLYTRRIRHQVGDNRESIDRYCQSPSTLVFLIRVHLKLRQRKIALIAIIIVIFTERNQVKTLYRRLTNQGLPRLVWGNLPTGWILGFWGRFGALFGGKIRGEVEITSPFYGMLYIERVEKMA